MVVYYIHLWFPCSLAHNLLSAWLEFGGSATAGLNVGGSAKVSVGKSSGGSSSCAGEDFEELCRATAKAGWTCAQDIIWVTEEYGAETLSTPPVEMTRRTLRRISDGRLLEVLWISDVVPEK